MVGRDGVDAVLVSARVKGAAVSSLATKRLRQQRDAFKVRMGALSRWSLLRLWTARMAPSRASASSASTRACA
eukprot:13337280-Heterocapsa_arctica.AAC.1